MSQIINPPSEIKLFPIRGCILPPGEHLPLNVFEPRYLNMADDALAGDGFIGSAARDALSAIRKRPTAAI